MVNNNLGSISTNACKKALAFFLVVSCAFPAAAKVKKGQPAATDTFKLAKLFIAKKKFGKANKILKAYQSAHPKDLNAVWMRAQVNLYSNNFKQSDKLYKDAVQMAPNNDYLKLNYIHSLADMGNTGMAANMLYVMENNGADYSDMALLHARLHYYDGDNKKAAAYVKKAMQYDNKSPEANELNDMIEAARAPKVSLYSSLLADNQPLTALITSVRAEKSFSKYLSPYIDASDYHFMQTTTSDAPWIKAGNRMFFPKAGVHFNYGAGVMRFPVKDKMGVTGEVNLNKKISQQFNIDLTADHVPYFGTKTSIDTAISATRFSAMLNWHKSNWQGQAAFMNSAYPNSSNVYALYGWILAPVAVFPTGKFQMGLSSSYSNSNQNRYVAEKSLSSILTTYTPTNTNITGLFNPYFTPRDMVINTVLFSLGVNASKQVDININGDVGYGSVLNPYLYLDKTSSGTVVLAKNYSTEHFIPFSGAIAMNYHIDKTWLLVGKYTYRSTYFFNSNYLTVGLEKSFQHRNKNAANNKKSAFARSIQDIEDKIQSLYRVKNSKDLKQSVNSIKNQIIALRDTQQKRKNMTEVTPGSEEAARLRDRVSSLNEMLADIEAVNMDEAETGNKREWLVDKQFELTSIHYNGIFDEE